MTKRPAQNWLTTVMLAGLLTCGAPNSYSQLSADAYESVDTRRASEILSSEVLQSGNHRVEDEASITQNLYQFSIESDYGQYHVQSLPMLVTRTHELQTLAQAIGQYKEQDQQFADNLRGQLTYDADSLVDVVVAPFSMAAQLASNIGQTAQEFTELPKSSANLESPNYVDDLSNDVVRGAHKRNIAFQLNLDVYSTNPKVQDFLNKVATARSRGHFSAGVATIRVPSVKLRTVLDGSLDAEIRNAMRSLTPIQLEEAVREQLLAMGVGAERAKRFADHQQFSPRHKVAIVAHLDFLRGVTDRGLLVRSMLAARSETDALAYEYLVRMLAGYHEQVEKLEAIEAFAALPVARTVSRTLVLAMPVDELSWTRSNDEAFASMSERLAGSSYKGARLILSGFLTDRAKAGVGSYGFKYSEDFMNLSGTK